MSKEDADFPDRQRKPHAFPGVQPQKSMGRVWEGMGFPSQ